MPFDDLILEEYSTYSLVVYGNTKNYIEELKQLGGKYNPNLKKGSVCIFSKKSESELKKWLDEGTGMPKEVTNEIPKETKRKTHNESYEHLLEMIKELTIKVETLEKYIASQQVRDLKS
jgi:hypothetical protein